MIRAGLIFLCLAIATNVQAADESFDQWREGFTARAVAKGHDPDQVKNLLGELTADEKVLERDRFQPEFTRPIWAYLDSAVSDVRGASGKAAMADHSQLLTKLEADSGVPAEVITAIWGLESAYGKIQGNFDIVRSLATLAHDGRRRTWAERELMAVLTMLETGQANREQLKGAWAGAMGQTQFLPSTFLQYAVDGDGDGIKNIWGSEADALASTANYMQRHHWTRGEDWGEEVQVPAHFDYMLADDSVLSIGSWEVRNVTPISGRKWDPLELGRGMRLLLPAGANGPKILVGGNFRVFKRYNNSTAYALGVGLLSRALVGAPGLIAGWPTEVQPLSRAQIKQMQELLKSNGHDPGGADGLAGPNTRRALREYQQRIGLIPDGFASIQVLENLKVSQPPQ